MQQLFTIFRNLKWMIAVSLVISIALFLPAQVQELYRITAADGGWSVFKQFVAIAAIAGMIWFGAFLLAVETWHRMKEPMDWRLRVLRWLPITLGALPIVAAMAAQFSAMSNIDKVPEAERERLREVGNIFRIQESALADVDLALLVFAGAFAVIAIVFVLLTMRAGRTAARLSTAANVVYFGREWFLLLTAIVIAGSTAIVVAFPDSPAQRLETFGVVAIFTLCVVAFVVHVSLLTLKHRFPIFPFIFGWMLLVALIGTNDNHHIRLLEAKDASAPAPRMSAQEAFKKWMDEPDRKASPQEYPVFIVTAQGGGLYAAQNAATFLARMQDLCPAFRRHLFAISAVSGGSVGASIFAAALHSDDQASGLTPPTRAQRLASAKCDKIADFLAGARSVRGLDLPGRIEQKVHTVLATDFLSPLVAASLFSDFTQGFVPAPIPPFDRARSLEYALENAADDLEIAQDARSNKAAPAAPRTNLLKLDFQAHWKPDNGMPALLLNATDAGSGKRVVIAPFDLDKDHPRNSDVCMLATVTRKEGSASAERSESLRLPLSTAAFISARFPWVSPAATVSIKNDCITRKPIARLVDGGYIDNSGVETALNLYEELQKLRKDRAAGLPPFQVYVISLTGGDFPDHGWFNLSEVLEPIRALLSGRTSRAYIALNRAAADVTIASSEVSIATAEEVSHFPPFRRTDLRNHFYELPLGWALSDKSRDIVSLNSGRYWDCKPDGKFLQTRTELSAADCVQIQVHHLLNGSTRDAFKAQRFALKVREDVSRRLPSETKLRQKVGHETLLACYEENWFHARDKARYEAGRKAWEARTDAAKPARYAPYRERYLAYFQSERVRALLTEWDRYRSDDPRILAYMLASISYDSADFNRTTEKLSFTKVSDIPDSWLNRIRNQGIDVNTLLNNPEAMANAVWASPQNSFGNLHGSGDGWKYRSRGIYQKVGRAQYKEANDHLRALYNQLKIDVLEFPDAMLDPMVAAKVAMAHFHSRTYRASSGVRRTLVQLLTETPYDPNAKVDWKAIRALQDDMDEEPEHQAMVAARADMFLACIGKAPKAPPETLSVASLRRVPDVLAHLVGLRAYASSP